MKVGQTFQLSTGTFRISEVGIDGGMAVYGCILERGTIDPSLSEFVEGGMLRVGEQALSGIMNMQLPATEEERCRKAGRLDGFFR